MIPQQVDSIDGEGNAGVIKVLSSDTDVFVLLCGHLFEKKWSSKVYMDPYSSENKIISINKSVRLNSNIEPS